MTGRLVPSKSHPQKWRLARTSLIMLKIIFSVPSASIGTPKKNFFLHPSRMRIFPRSPVMVFKQ
jgi:hypothetical protein